MASVWLACCFQILGFGRNDENENIKLQTQQSQQTLATDSGAYPPIETPQPTKPTQPVKVSHSISYAQASGGSSSAQHSAPVVAAFQNTVHKTQKPTATQKQFKRAEDIPDELFKQGATLGGVCTKMMDGDTFKFYHKLSNSDPTPRSIDVLKQETFTVRLAGIDCPETDHGPGKPGQPFGKEAVEFLASMIDRQWVTIKILDRDQYGRIVARVLESKSNSDCSLLLLKQGLAHVYKGKGAVYGGMEKEYNEALQYAKSQKLGVWSVSGLQSPAEYKRNQRS